ncbi:MAG: class I SAM-dependent methyltransferase [Planctomycetes bacterium]|nr:class I SAM-dependent methyltransferase [Planctomycetota bacterium]
MKIAIKQSGRHKKNLGHLIESKAPLKKSFKSYREEIQKLYDGPAGAFLFAGSFVSGHAPMAKRLFRPGAFDLTGSKLILDAGCGAGKFTDIILKRCDADAQVFCFDLSVEMLRRGVRHFKSGRAFPAAADITRLPYRDGSFDCVICGWVLEHLPDPLYGLREIARVLKPRGRMLILTTESTFFGAWVSRFYKCRTYRRDELMSACHQAGLQWKREFWWSRLHRFLKLGGILVAAEKMPASRSASPRRRAQVQKPFS